MDDARTPLTGTELVDALEQVLVAQFGLRSATEHARQLLGDGALAAANDRFRQARVARSEAIASSATLEAIGTAGERERQAAACIKQLEAWRGRERAEASLALDIFVGARSLGSAAGPIPAQLYLRAPKLRIAGHFEPDIELLIHDRELGTLGMIQLLDAVDPAAIRAQVSRYVDQATYLRHLLLTARDEHGGDDRQIVTVELVLVHRADEWSAELGPDRPFDLLYEVGEILRDLALETNCLHTIGVNVLAGGKRGFTPANLRRAFAWLLHDARRWFASLEQRRIGRGSTGQPQFGRLRSIEIDEYRLPGVRTLELAPDTRLHLLHGHNGSGKSTLVEALELMLTGSIERLAGIEDYERVTRNRWATRPARITLHPFDDRLAPLGFELRGAARPPTPMAPGSRASSFRLDQTVMDRLARASDVDRAAELLAAFFADEAEIRERWHAAVVAAEAALARLPARIQTWLESCRRKRQDLHEVVVEQLAGLSEGRIGPALLDALLPLPRVQLRPFHGQIPALAELEERIAAQGHVGIDDELLVTIDAGFAHLTSDVDHRVATVEAVMRTLERVGRWWTEGVEVGFASEDAYAEALDEWLELTALVELGEQQRRVLAILHGARIDGWDPRRLEQAGSAAKLLRSLAEVETEVIDDLARACERWAERRDRLARGLRKQGDGEAGEKPVAAARVRLDAHEVAELDRFGRWWAPTETGPGLGQRIQSAIEGREPRSFVGVDIGAQAWVTPIHEAAERMLEPLRTLRQQARRAPERMSAEEHFDDMDAAGEQAFADWHEAEEADHRKLADATEDDAPTPVQAPAPMTTPSAVAGPSRTPTPTAAPMARSIESARPAAPQSETIAVPKPALELAPVAPVERRPDLAAALAMRDRNTIELAETSVEHSLAAIIERLADAYEVSLAAHEVGTKVQDSFVARLAARDERALGLVDALNELMALFTPARWAYEDVVLRYEQDGDVSRLQFETGDVREPGKPARARADLRLNTAQLNAFTLALFLLCAPRVDNPLGLLVLDDPLQNMDELTVTTLARGLAKLLRVLPEHWSLMMLFHGEGDLARFHDEVECGVYFLPWLSPTIRGRKIEIGCRRQDSRLGLEIQAIEDLLGLRP
jgi:energy-coupling factor transporter ATP-binding protein EcfA2